MEAEECASGAFVQTSCSIGRAQESECHKTTYGAKCGIRFIHELDESDQDLLLWRSGIHPVGTRSTFPGNFNVCYHHMKVFLHKYSFLQRSCFDPFRIHKKTVRCSLREVDIKSVLKVNQFMGLNMKPGQKLCSRCVTLLKNEEYSDNVPDSDEEYQPPSTTTDEQLNNSVTALGLSPMKTQKVGKRDRSSYGRRKLQEAQMELKHKLADTLMVKEEELSAPKEQKSCQKCSDLDKIVHDLKEKCAISTRQKKVAILTLAPSSWSIENTAKEFSVSTYMVKQARKLKATQGVHPELQMGQDKQLSSEIKVLVLEFYENNDYSRIMPGKKEYITVKMGNVRVQMQKRLLLCNISELYVEFKEKYPNAKVGLSSFFNLRPKWVVPVSARGTHNVCVCETHQNTKLMFAAIKDSGLDYKGAMKLLVCDISSYQCMIHRCEKCPGKAKLAEHMNNKLYGELLMDDDELVSYKQWTHMDRTSLETKQSTVEDFVEMCCQKTDKLTTHSFTATAQSAYLQFCKDNLKQDEIIVILDFSENYAFIVQDAIQGYHWDNSQATLHPFAIYYRDESGGVSVMNLCIFSDCLIHDAIAVHAHIRIVMAYVKNKLPHIHFAKYFSDGAASQYKNCKNLKNLCLHYHDFEIHAEWNFFATSHGKNICDGIGATVKRMASRASLQHPTEGHILTPLQLFTWAQKNISGIQSFYISKDEVKSVEELLKSRLEHVKTIAGTRSHHHFSPVDSDNVQISRLSGYNYRFMHNMCLHSVSDPGFRSKSINVQPGCYVIAIYDDKWYLGCVSECCEAEGDVLVNFMAPAGPARSFHWPHLADMCWIPFEHILMTVAVPTTVSGRQYNLPLDVQSTAAKAQENFCSKQQSTGF